MILNNALEAGVKNRMLRFRFKEQRRDLGAVEHVLQSLEVVRCRSSDSCNWPLSAVNSSFRDCSSSLMSAAPRWWTDIPPGTTGFLR